MSVDREKLTDLKESFWKEPVKEATATKKELAAAAERTKHAMSFLRKIHKATEAGSLESVLDAIEKSATKGDIDDKQETRLKDACKRRKETLASNPKETEPTATEEQEVAAYSVLILVDCFSLWYCLHIHASSHSSVTSKFVGEKI